jgi:hypothetical protein
MGSDDPIADFNQKLLSGTYRTSPKTCARVLVRRRADTPQDMHEAKGAESRLGRAAAGVERRDGREVVGSLVG